MYIIQLVLQKVSKSKAVLLLSHNLCSPMYICYVNTEIFVSFTTSVA